MPHHRRSKSYQLRDRQIDPQLTYDGIKTNPLPYIDNDIHPVDDHSLCLAELYSEHWDVNSTTEQIFLRDPFVLSTCDEEEIAYLKTVTHPLKWLYDLIKNERLQMYYSAKECTLTLNYSLISKGNFNLFVFYKSCKQNEKTNRFFKHLFQFNDYQSISHLYDMDTSAMNIIDFIYQEIQATTMLNIDEHISLPLLTSFLKNDVIELKDHQVKSIHWMLKREREFSSTNVYTPLHCCRDLSDKLFYVHIIDGVVLHDDEVNSRYNQEKFPLPGGILCDEMEDFLKVNITQPIDNDEEEKLVKYKKFKLDDPVDLPCLCGKIANRSPNLTADSILVCIQCSRYVHKTCFIREEQETFLCPYCEQRLSNTSELLPTKATLIIAPGAIIDQWIEEISKHLDYPLDIYMYEGVVNKIPIPDRHYLAKQDFIFCSYENLRKDIHHNEACSHELHSTRTQVRKYEYLISPLLRMKFWRLVLDEAQMVDTPKAPTSIMARSLVAHHRWFVTGTPFHRSINDLEGIVQYLFPSIDTPRDQMSTLLRMKDKVHEVFLSWLMDFLKLITRRTSRQCLNDLPEQYERVIRLQFSELERTYYNRIWNECRDDFKREFQHLWQKRERDGNGGVLPDDFVAWTFESSNEIDMNDIHFLSSTARSCLQTPLIKLRCLCDHPQVGAYGVRHNDPALVHYYNRFHYSSNRNFSIRHSNNSLETTAPLTKDDQPFTMKDLLDLLTARELESGEDCLRLSLLNFNGLAGLYLIQYQHEATRPIIDNNNKNDQHYIQMVVRTYERVIETAESYKEPFHADSFQLAHAYYNLSHSIKLATELTNVSSKLTSVEAYDEFNKIKQRHQTQSEHEMSEAWKTFNEKLLTKKDVKSEIKALLEDISTHIKPIENDKLDIHYHVNRERRLPFTTWNGFLLALVEEFDKLQGIRENLLIYIDALKRTPNDDDVAKMSSCSKCGFDNDSTNEHICIFCECDVVMKSYHCSLQPELYSEKQINEDGGAYVIYYINEILSKASMRSHDSTRQLAKLLRTDWNDLLKKLRLENTSARAYSQQLKHLYLSLDEMLQCTSRLEFYVGDIKNRPRKFLNRYRFNAELIEDERHDFEQQALDYLKKVIKHRQQFHYFQEQQQDYHRSITTTNLLPNQRTKCPMCHELFGDDRPDVCFFLCGHFFCRECSLQWKKHVTGQQPNRSRIKCPICRRDIPVNSLTVLKWKDQNAPIQKSFTENCVADSITSPRIRRLMETQEKLTIQGRYGTKVDSIVSFILNLLNDDIQQSANNVPVTTVTNEFKAPVKILVFSQFTDVLNVLAISLKLNAISHLHFTSTKILQQFRQDPSISVLLMPLGKGANGLNLTEAQHVILVEPQLHRSVELQAIARVRRLGQKFNTYVYRFIISDTAEEVVLADSRTAQTMPNNHRTTTTTAAETFRSEHSSANRATSFADIELFYEINMAKKIFVKPTLSTIVDTELNPTTVE
ncbi:unnamed protein product [Adineta ricciae]|uniref:RING-type domain-containing protein n=1 Tax=Adineta ricciae TaxID=249248 RepID=A0A813YZR7_ADIRI|nr:unnamed protein product [Adineta ricciae]CAF1251810.1 unnamed protein product [Adineta ricciae]